MQRVTGAPMLVQPARSISPSTPSPRNSSHAPSSVSGLHRVRALLTSPRLLVVVLLCLMLAASFLSYTLYVGDGGAWGDIQPFYPPAVGDAYAQGGVGPGAAGGASNVPSWKLRPVGGGIGGGGVRLLAEHNGTSGIGLLDDRGPRPANDPMTLVSRCHNTKQGRKLVTDDSGAICARQSLLLNGCCRSSMLIATRSCGMCRTDVQCCRSYEYCVSCCLNALDGSDRADDSASAEAAGARARFSFHSFDRCLHLCRTSSRSIKHGNVYKTSVLKHCYTEGEHALPVSFDDNAKLIVANQGVSCTRACNAYRGEETVAPAPVLPASDDVPDPDAPTSVLPPPALPVLFICHEAFLPLVNTCDKLKQHFSCAGDSCETSAGNDQPALAVPAPPRAGALTPAATANAAAVAAAVLKPAGKCLVNGDAKLFDCEGHHEATRRLCVCIAADKAE